MSGNKYIITQGVTTSMEKNRIRPIPTGKSMRMSYQRQKEVLEMPNLIEVQKDSYDWFLRSGLKEVFDDISPISDYGGRLSLEFVDFTLCEDDVKYSIEECKQRDATYAAPFMIMMFRQASRSFPHDIIEAARLDGLSETGIFFRMYMPTMKSTYAAATIITFMNAWNNYLWPKVILQNNESITMPMLVANLLGGYTVDYGVLMLGVFICTIPTAIIFFCFQKSFTEGITGAVK